MQPTKEQLRKWQEQNRKEHRPPPTPEDIRRELGWTLEQERLKEEQRNRK
jgi:hypothetical protein